MICRCPSSNPLGSFSRSKTRSYVVSKDSNFIGQRQDFQPNKASTLRAVTQRSILIKQEIMMDEETQSRKLRTVRFKGVGSLSSGAVAQANAKFCPPVTVKKSLAARIQRLWAMVDKMTWGGRIQRRKRRWRSCWTVSWTSSPAVTPLCCAKTLNQVVLTRRSARSRPT